MESLETNKAVAAVLTAGVVFMLATVASDWIINPEIPKKLAIKVEGVKEEGAPEAAAPGGGAPEVPIAVALQTADAKAGDAAAHKLCVSCHSFDKGGPAKVGPNLYGVVGAPHGHMAGYDYTAALKSKQGPWTYDELNTWLTNPRGYAPGTKMAFAGIGNEKQRADVIAYLRSLSDNPEPLPPVPAGAEPAAAQAPAPPANSNVAAPQPAEVHPGAAPAPASGQLSQPGPTQNMPQMQQNQSQESPAGASNQNPSPR